MHQNNWFDLLLAVFNHIPYAVTTSGMAMIIIAGILIAWQGGKRGASD